MQGVSIGTIKTKANVCCVQFPLDSSRSLAFGSADHKIYYYDLRNLKTALCTFIGHNKTVSYIKFVDATSIVSASTDNTLKLWDLSTCTSRVNDTPVQSFTGHMNVKVHQLFVMLGIQIYIDVEILFSPMLFCQGWFHFKWYIDVSCSFY